MANCDVFISYRREGGRDIARCLQLALTARGAKCFFDLHDSRKGKFPEKINSAIEGAKYFVLLLTKGNTLDKCADPKDWVRQEIAYAIEKNVPIIPVVPSDHPKRFSNVPLPRAIAAISDIQMSELNLEGNFEHDVDLLMEERLEKIALKNAEGDVQERESVFLSAAQRYKSNDGKIDDEERTKLDKLAAELSISPIRRTALIEQVEAQYEMTQNAAKVFLTAARRHKNDDGKIDDDERADLEALARRLSLGTVKCEELVQHVEEEYEALRKKAPATSGMGRDVTFNPARGEFELSDAAPASVPAVAEPKKSRYTVIADVLAARFAALPSDSKLFVSDIPFKKRAKAWRSMNVREQEDSICLLYDDTVFGSASEGLVVTNEAVYFKNIMEHPVRLRLDKVGEVKLVKDNLISISGYGCECHMLEKNASRALCKALDGLGAELAKLGVTFGDDTSAVDAVTKLFADIKDNGDVYVGDNIPEKKRANAHRSLRVKEPVSDICVLADATVFGSAEEGLVVTPKAIYFKNSFESANRIPREEIRKVEVRKQNLIVNGIEFTSIGSSLEQAAPLLAKGIRRLAL